MKFQISKKHLDRRRRSPILFGCLITVISTITYLLGDWTFLEVFIFTTLFLVLIVIPNWIASKRYIEGAGNHHIEVNNSKILCFGDGYKSETDLDLISSIVLNKNRAGVKSIILKDKKGPVARLEHYERIDELSDSIKKEIPNAKVIEKRWIHS